MSNYKQSKGVSYMNLLMFYGIPLAFGALFFATEHYGVLVAYVIATALQDFLPKIIMNKDGDARLLFLLHLLAQAVVTVCAIYAIYLIIVLLFF